MINHDMKLFYTFKLFSDQCIQRELCDSRGMPVHEKSKVSCLSCFGGNDRGSGMRHPAQCEISRFPGLCLPTSNYSKLKLRFFGANCNLKQHLGHFGADPWRGFEDVPTGIQAAITPPGAGTVGWCQ